MCLPWFSIRPKLLPSPGLLTIRFDLCLSLPLLYSACQCVTPEPATFPRFSWLSTFWLLAGFSKWEAQARDWRAEGREKRVFLLLSSLPAASPAVTVYQQLMEQEEKTWILNLLLGCQGIFFDMWMFNIFAFFFQSAFKDWTGFNIRKKKKGGEI